MNRMGRNHMGLGILNVRNRHSLRRIDIGVDELYKAMGISISKLHGLILTDPKAFNIQGPIPSYSHM